MVSRPRTRRGRPARSTDIEQLALSALRRRPSQQRGAERVRDVIDAFEMLLAKKRFEDITMDDLSRTAGIQIGSLYHFFPDMTAVILTVLERALADEGSAFEPTPSDEELDFPGYLSALEQRLSAVWHAHGRLLDVFFAYQRHPLIWELTLQQRERTARLVGNRLASLLPGLPETRLLELGRMIGMVMAVLLDNLIYLPDAERLRLRRETHAMLGRYVAGEITAPARDAGGTRRKRPARS
ncbi:MAG: TetR/AcrR family transcriptional regulator [Gammaproteobacteria bacterium]